MHQTYEYHIIIDQISSNSETTSIKQTCLKLDERDSGSLLFVNVHDERCCGGENSGNSSNATVATNALLSMIDAKISVTGNIDADYPQVAQTKEG